MEVVVALSVLELALVLDAPADVPGYMLLRKPMTFERFDDWEK